MVDLALVPANNSLNMVLNDGRQTGLVTDIVHPARKLGVPHKSMPANELAVLLREVDEVVGRGPVKLAAIGLDLVPLHRVLRSDLTKVGLDDVGVLAGGQAVLVGAGAKVLLALGLDQLVDGLRGLPLLKGGGEDGDGCQEADEARGELHCQR